MNNQMMRERIVSQNNQIENLMISRQQAIDALNTVKEELRDLRTELFDAGRLMDGRNHRIENAAMGLNRVIVGINHAQAKEGV